MLIVTFPYLLAIWGDIEGSGVLYKRMHACLLNSLMFWMFQWYFDVA